MAVKNRGVTISGVAQEIALPSPGQALLDATERWSNPAAVAGYTEEEWIKYGVALGRMERLIGFALGDWWNSGPENRVDIVRSPDWPGPSYSTCRNAGAVASKFPFSRRRDNLSFSHHEAVASQPPEDANRILRSLEEKALETGVVPALRSVRQLVKRERREQREQELSAVTEAASAKIGHKLYGVVYADPPWRFEPYSRTTGMDRSAENHYDCMDTEDIAMLRPPAAASAVLFLWVTVPMLVEGLNVAQSWGFNYKSNWVWVKNKPGTGYWGRNQHEMLVLCTRGNPVAPAPGQQPPSVQMEPVGRHSAKPKVYHKLIEKMYPTTARIDMFARSYTPGWDAFGNELPDKLVAAD